MENATHSHSSMPLVSRLDNLDFILKYLEGKQRLPKCSMRGTERQPAVPLDLAVREAYFKGSLMERVAFLERRLFQQSEDAAVMLKLINSLGNPSNLGWSGSDPCSSWAHVAAKLSKSIGREGKRLSDS
ncbi:uncharacterized protein LOC110602072 [Manihot esculenta]|uniref:uncharacterized protein LOC110602072 n=1 Tax=Manihot esculenta TaxID=3983 RepID=UPI000B5D73FC|nr:uncharacterized protein LOC110602072 [Manihot esculenta]